MRFVARNFATAVRCRIAAAALVCITAVCLLPAPVQAETADVTEQQQWRLAYDRIINVDITLLPNYMQYAGSGMYPVDRLIVSSQKTGASLAIRNLYVPTYAATKYEEYWYHAAYPIGIRRFTELPLFVDEQVAIYFHSNGMNEVRMHSQAVADCAVRLMLEIGLKRGIPAAVLVPEDCVDSVASAMESLGFARINNGVSGATLLTMKVLSYDGSSEQYMYFRPST